MPEREKKKESFVIVTEGLFSFFVLGREGEGKGNYNNWIGTKHAFKTERVCRIPISKWFRGFAPQVSLVLNACFAPIRSI